MCLLQGNGRGTDNRLLEKVDRRGKRRKEDNRGTVKKGLERSDILLYVHNSKV